MDNTKARLELIEGAIVDSVEDYGDYETVKLDSADAHWLIDKVRELEKETLWLYGKLNQISDVIENGRKESTIFIPIKPQTHPNT